jgi:hypothetical protein
MKFDFFKVPDKNSNKGSQQIKVKEKEACPYCGKRFISVNRHLPYCDKNPKINMEKKEQKKEKETDQNHQESRTFTEIKNQLREDFLKSLNSDQLGKLELTPQEKDVIEDVMQFMGGTEGYQFIYKALTGQKIRGKMTEIIDECIKWLQKHKLYILWHK